MTALQSIRTNDADVDRLSALKLVASEAQSIAPIQVEAFAVDGQEYLVRRLSVLDAALCRKCTECTFAAGRDGQGMCVTPR